MKKVSILFLTVFIATTVLAPLQTQAQSATSDMDASVGCVEGTLQASVIWSPVAELDEYRLRRADIGIIATGGKNFLSHVDSNLSPKTGYRYEIQGMDYEDNTWRSQDFADVITTSCIHVSNLTAPANVEVDGYISISATFTWDSNNAATYEIGLYNNIPNPTDSPIDTWGGAGLSNSPQTLTTPATQIQASVAPGSYKICAKGSIPGDGLTHQVCRSIEVTAAPSERNLTIDGYDNVNLEITKGDSATAGWTSSNTQECRSSVSSGHSLTNWAGDLRLGEATSGSRSVGPFNTVTTPTTPYKLRLSCEPAGGAASLDMIKPLATDHSGWSAIKNFVKIASAYTPEGCTYCDEEKVFVNEVLKAVINVSIAGNNGESITATGSGTNIFSTLGVPTPGTWDSTSNISGSITVPGTLSNGREFDGWTGGDCANQTSTTCTGVSVVTGSSETVTANYVEPPAESRDLTVTGITTDPSQPIYKNQSTAFLATVKNIGANSIGQTTLTRLQIDLDNNSPDTMWDVTLSPDQSTGNLAPNATEVERLSEWIAQVGTHQVRACADAGNAVAETSESNNCYSIVIVVPSTPNPNNANLNINSTGASNVSITGTYQGTTNYVVSQGSNISGTLYAPETASGQYFQNWTGSCDSYVANSRNCSVSVTAGAAAETVTAVYGPNPPGGEPVATINVNSTGASGVTITRVSGPSNIGGTTNYTRTYTTNTTGSISAPATVSGQNFQNWSGGDCNGVTSTTCSFSVSTGSEETVTAVYAPTPPPDKPDLLIQSITPSIASPKVGNSVNFSAVVKNNGTASTGQTSYTRLRIDYDSNGGGVLWDYNPSNQTTTTLGAGATQTENWTSWTAVEGTHLVRVYADATGVVDESNEENNFSDITIVVTADEPPEDGVATLNVKSDHEVSWKRADNIFISGNYVGVTDYVVTKEGENISGVLQAPMDGAGWYFQRWVGDCDAYVDKSQTCNVNVVAGAAAETVTAMYGDNPITNQPNLVISDLWAPSSAKIGDRISFSATAKNIGNVASGASDIRLRMDKNNDSSGWDTSFVRKNIGGLAPNGTETENWSNVWTAIAGTHELYACVDDYNTVNESSETDNCLTTYFTVADVFNYSLSTPADANAFKQSTPVNTQTSITKTLVSGTTESVNLSLSGAPSGVSYTISGNPSNPTSSSNIVFTVQPDAPTGTYPITVTGTPLNKTAGFDLIISGNPIVISCVPSPQTALIGETVTWTANVSGGTAPYTYSWSGAGVPSDPAPETNPYSLAYSTIGAKAAIATATDADGLSGSCTGDATVQVNFDPDFQEF